MKSGGRAGAIFLPIQRRRSLFPGLQESHRRAVPVKAAGTMAEA